MNCTRHIIRSISRIIRRSRTEQSQTCLYNFRISYMKNRGYLDQMVRCYHKWRHWNVFAERWGKEKLQNRHLNVGWSRRMLQQKKIIKARILLVRCFFFFLARKNTARSTEEAVNSHLLVHLTTVVAINSNIHTYKFSYHNGGKTTFVKVGRNQDNKDSRQKLEFCKQAKTSWKPHQKQTPSLVTSTVLHINNKYNKSNMNTYRKILTRFHTRWQLPLADLLQYLL